MAKWTATLLEIRREDDRTLGVILYTDNVTTKLVLPMQLDRLSVNAFRAQVQANLDALSSGYDFIASLTLGPIDTTPVP